MKLKLERPVVFFDLETTGTNILNDRIVELSAVKLMPDGNRVVKTVRVNPTIPIPEEASAVHHIYDEDVADKPTFAAYSKSIAQFFSGCDIAGFNSNRFDVPLLDQEFERAGIDFDFEGVRFIDVQTIFHKKEPRTLVAAYKFYCDKDLEEAHSASADTMATVEVLLAQMERYTDLPEDIDALSEFASNNRQVDFCGRLIYDDQNREVINFGKYKGRLAEEVLRQDPGYLAWIMIGDFTKNTNDCFTRIRKRLNERTRR